MNECVVRSAESDENPESAPRTSHLAPNTDWLEKFTESISDDLNIPQALALCWEMLDDDNLKKEDKLETAKKMDEVLGLKLDEPEKALELPEEIKLWIAERDQARKNKDWTKADELRDQIEASGKWKVSDNEGGTYVTKK